MLDYKTVGGEIYVKARCTEGDKSAPEFKFNLKSDIGGEPEFTFELPSECWPESFDLEPDYEGAGLFMVDFEGLLKSFLNSHRSFDHCESSHKVSALMRKYADLIDSDVKEFKDPN